MLFLPCLIKIEDSLVSAVAESDRTKEQTFVKAYGISNEFVRKNDVRVMLVFKRNVLIQISFVQSIETISS
jgi:hypothetical protein